MNKVWLTGDAVVDLIPDTNTTYLKCPGGAPANVAVAIARLGGDTGFFGRVGKDPLGMFMQQTLAAEKVNVEALKLDADQRTSTVIVGLDEHGERSFTFMVKPSADQFLTNDDLPAFAAGEWLHCCSIALANEPSRSATLEAMQRIKAAGGFVSFDPNLRDEVWANPSEIIPVVREALKLADVIKFSEEELFFLAENTDNNVEQSIAALGLTEAKLIVLTLGAKGAQIFFAGENRIIAGKAVKPVDTTGAGDAFVGGMLARLAQSADWNNVETVEAAIAWGNACGALATTQKGAMTALPTRDQLIEILG